MTKTLADGANLVSDRCSDSAGQIEQFQHRIEYGVVLDLVRLCRLGPVLRFFSEVIGRDSCTLVVRKNPPQPLDRARHVQLEDSRQDVVARHAELRD